MEKVCRLCRGRRRGAAAVEFAFVAPVFFLLVFGMIEFGRMVMVQQVITNASREGARLGVLDGTTQTEIEDIVDNYLASARIRGAPVPTIKVNGVVENISNAAYGDRIEVTVSVPFDEVSWLPSPMFIKNTNLSASTVMRREAVQ